MDQWNEKIISSLTFFIDINETARLSNANCSKNLVAHKLGCSNYKAIMESTTLGVMRKILSTKSVNKIREILQKWATDEGNTEEMRF